MVRAFGAAVSVVWVLAACVPLRAQGTGATPPEAAPAVSPSQRLTGKDGWASVVGNTVVGSTPDGPYTEFFEQGGVVRHVDKDGPDKGRWVLRDALVCLLFPSDDEEDCRKVEVTGAKGVFLDTDGTRYAFDILPGNPKGL